MASATGVGPNHSDDAIQVRISARAPSSAARLAWAAACSQASAAAAGVRLVPVQPGLESPGAAEAVLVVVGLEDREHLLHGLRGLLAPALARVQQPEELQLHEYVRMRPLVPGPGCHQPSLVQHPVRFREPAGRDQRGGDLRQQLRAPRHVVGRGGRRALEQADRRGQVAARECAAPGLFEPL